MGRAPATPKWPNAPAPSVSRTPLATFHRWSQGLRASASRSMARGEPSSMMDSALPQVSRAHHWAALLHSVATTTSIQSKTGSCSYTHLGQPCRGHPAGSLFADAKNDEPRGYFCAISRCTRGLTSVASKVIDSSSWSCGVPPRSICRKWRMCPRYPCRCTMRSATSSGDPT